MAAVRRGPQGGLALLAAQDEMETSLLVSACAPPLRLTDCPVKTRVVDVPSASVSLRVTVKVPVVA